MLIDLDKNLAAAQAQQMLLKWNLELSVGGTAYRIRPMTNIDVARLAQIRTVGNDASAGEFLADLLEEPKPELPKENEAIAAMLLSVTFYLQDHLKKKSQILAQVIQLDIARSSTSSNS